jgi:hypothetical protein
MAITNAQQVDVLWKKLIFGVTETNVTGKFPSNETIASPLPVYSTNIWAQTDSVSIPATPPTTNSSTVAVYTVSANSVIQATTDPTATLNQTWLATTVANSTTSIVGSWIPPTFNPLYVIQVYIGNPNGGPAVRILPDTSNEEWVFDYNAGVLYFMNNVPASKTATIGTGTVTVSGNGIYFVGYRYIGTKGFSTATGSKVNVVANIAARNALTGVNTGDIAHVIDATSDVTNSAPGNYANYLWDGSAWSLLSTQASAKSDAATEVVTTITPSSNASTALGYISGGNRIAAVTVTVSTVFDGTLALSAGDSSNSSNIISNAMVDLTKLGIYTATPDYVYAANTQTDMFVYLTGTATVGSAKVVITFA